MVTKFQDHMKTIQVLHDYDIDYVYCCYPYVFLNFHYDLSLSSLHVDKSDTFFKFEHQTFAQNWSRSYWLEAGY